MFSAGALLRAPRRSTRAQLLLSQAEGGRVRPCGLFIRALHPISHHHGREAGLQQFHRALFAVIRARTHTICVSACAIEYWMMCQILKRRKLENWLRKRNHRAKTVKADEIKTQNLKRWEEDYQLQDGGRLALFQEYLEMGISTFIRTHQNSHTLS